MSITNIQFIDKIRKFAYRFVFLSYQKNLVGTKRQVRISRGKRAIGVRAIEVRLYSFYYAYYTLYSRVHVCWSEHSDSSFVYGFMSLIYGLGTMTTTTL